MSLLRQNKIAHHAGPFEKKQFPTFACYSARLSPYSIVSHDLLGS